MGLRSVMCFLIVSSSRGTPPSTSMEAPGVEMWNESKLPERRAAGENALVARGGEAPIGCPVWSGEGVPATGTGKDGLRKAQTQKRRRVWAAYGNGSVRATHSELNSLQGACSIWRPQATASKQPQARVGMVPHGVAATAIIETTGTGRDHCDWIWNRSDSSRSVSIVAPKLHSACLSRDWQRAEEQS